MVDGTTFPGTSTICRGGERIHLGAVGEGALAGGDVRGLAAPGLQRGGLQGAAIGEGELPRQGAELRSLAAECAVASSSDWPPERKAMPGTAGGTQRFRTFRVFSATSSRLACLAHFLPEIDHVGLEDHAFELHAAR